jgi:hypothetical protein
LSPELAAGVLGAGGETEAAGVLFARSRVVGAGVGVGAAGVGEGVGVGVGFGVGVGVGVGDGFARGFDGPEVVGWRLDVDVLPVSLDPDRTRAE